MPHSGPPDHDLAALEWPRSAAHLTPERLLELVIEVLPPGHEPRPTIEWARVLLEPPNVWPHVLDKVRERAAEGAS